MNIDKSKLKTLWYQDKNGKGEIMKKFLLIIVATILIASALFLTACDKSGKTVTEQRTPFKGLNGEVVYDLGDYGAKRIMTFEYPNIEMNYKYMEIPLEECYVYDTKLFLIFFWSNDDEPIGGLWSYYYGWNQFGTLDDTWYLQDSIIV